MTKGEGSQITLKSRDVIYGRAHKIVTSSQAVLLHTGQRMVAVGGWEGNPDVGRRTGHVSQTGISTYWVSEWDMSTQPALYIGCEQKVEDVHIKWRGFVCLALMML